VSVGDFTAELRLDDGEGDLALRKVHAGTAELGVPFEALGANPCDALRVTLHLLRDGVELDRYPAAGPLEITVPDPHFEARNWTV